MCLFLYITTILCALLCKKKKKNDNFMCLLEFECAKRLKAHSRAIPAIINDIAFIMAWLQLSNRPLPKSTIDILINHKLYNISSTDAQPTGTTTVKLWAYWIIIQYLFVYYYLDQLVKRPLKHDYISYVNVLYFRTKNWTGNKQESLPGY